MRASSRRNPAYIKRKAAFRPILLAMCTGYFVSKTLTPLFLQWGRAVEFVDKVTYKAIDYSNNELPKGLQKIYPSNPAAMKGPETVLFGPDDRMYVLTEDANLVELRDLQQDDKNANVINATAVVVKDLGMGRPLGGRFTRDGTLYVADTLLGLTRVKDVHDATSKVEIVLNQIDGTPIRFANDVVIGPKSGKVYFTDSTTIAPDRLLKKNSWDTLYCSKIDLARGNQTGRLIEYNPKTDESRVLLNNIWFANGLGIDPDEKFLIIAETFALKLLRYDIAMGTESVAVKADEMPGYPDGADCSATHCYAVMPSSVVPLHKLFGAVPSWLSMALRNLVMIVPKQLAPKTKKFGGLVQHNIETKETQLLLDPKGETVAMLTGVTVHKNKLYLGSLQNDYVGVYEPKVM